MPTISAWLALCMAALIPAGLLGLQDDERLGDSVISEKSRNSFFDKLDNNDNGQLTIEEFQRFIKDTGGNALDDSSEIQSALANVMISLDDNADKIVKKKDLAAFWMQQASLLSVKEASDWARHSMHMPDDVVETFVRNAVTGYDFPELIENDGELIESELGIARKNLKRRLLRGMVMRFMGMGSFPPTPNNFRAKLTGCLEVKLSWDKFKTTDVYFPVHKYVVERFEPDVRGGTSSGSPGARWSTIYAGTGTDVIDNFSQRPANIEASDDELMIYRVTSWNAIGRSGYAEVKLLVPLDHLNCEVHRKDSILPLDYMVGSHGGKIHSTPPIAFSWMDGPLFYFGLIPVLCAVVIYLGLSFLGAVDDEERDNDKAAWRTAIRKAKSFVKLTRKKKNIIGNVEIEVDSPMTTHSLDSESPVSGYDCDIHTGYGSSDMSETQSVSSTNDGTKDDNKKTSKWSILRARVRSKQFSKVFGNGRNGMPPCVPAPHPVDETLYDKHGGIASTVRSTPPNKSRELAAADIFDDLTPSMYGGKPTQQKSSSTTGEIQGITTVLSRPSLPRARSFGDKITAQSKDDSHKNFGISNLFKNSQPSGGSCDNLLEMADNHHSRHVVKEKGKHCMQCMRSYTFGKRMKHRCGKCNESFCGECAFKVAHVFALPCKVPSQCLCKKCGHQ